MTYEVDQSGKVEETAKKTALALTNGVSKSIVLPAKEKRKLQEWFREFGLPRLFINHVFASLLEILLDGIKGRIVVDIEYPGQTQIIGEIVNKGIPVDIEWGLVGKHSKAHDLAYKVFVDKLVASKIISAEQVWAIFKKRTGGYLKTGLSPANRYSAPVTKVYDSTKGKKVKRKI